MTSHYDGIFGHKKTPLVTVIMNCYNGEKYVYDAIASVLIQTYSNWELIFWDNQSIDKSAQILKSFKDSRVKYYYAPKHTILYEARNCALEKASGEFIAFLDVDDYWLPQKLEQQVKLFESQEIGIVCANFLVESIRKKKKWVAYPGFIPQGMVLKHLLKNYFVGMLTLMVRRSILPKANPFDARFHIIGDFDLVIRLATSWKLAAIQNPLAVSRAHNNSESAKNRELLVSELETWYSENISQNVISNCENFHLLSNRILYYKAITSLLSRDRHKAICYMKKMTFGILKLRIIIGALLPAQLVIYLKN
jgi:glycosyltransferase involved in cell wall biosynthesis